MTEEAKGPTPADTRETGKEQTSPETGREKPGKTHGTMSSDNGNFGDGSEEATPLTRWPWPAQFTLALSVIVVVVALLVALPTVSMLVVERTSAGLSEGSLAGTMTFWGSLFAAFISLVVVFIGAVFAFTALKVEGNAAQEARRVAKEEARHEAKKEAREVTQQEYEKTIHDAAYEYISEEIEVDGEKQARGKKITRQAAVDCAKQYVDGKGTEITRDAAVAFVERDGAEITRGVADGYIREDVMPGAELVLKPAARRRKPGMNVPAPAQHRKLAAPSAYGVKPAAERIRKSAAWRRKPGVKAPLPGNRRLNSPQGSSGKDVSSTAWPTAAAWSSPRAGSRIEQWAAAAVFCPPVRRLPHWNSPPPRTRLQRSGIPGQNPPCFNRQMEHQFRTPTIYFYGYPEIACFGVSEDCNGQGPD